MDKFPLLWEGKAIGELTVEQEALYTWFEAVCRLPEGGLWCAWIVGDRGELRLGVLEPSAGRSWIRRKFSRRMSEPIGTPVRGEVRPASAVAESGDWETVASPELLFRTPWLRQQLRGTVGVLARRRGAGRTLALPYEPGRPFPLPSLFCLARVERIGERYYVLYTFDRDESPVF